MGGRGSDTEGLRLYIVSVGWNGALGLVMYHLEVLIG